MATKKMFLTYTGTLEAFKNSNKATECYNSIVFIGNGEAVYTHGLYFGDLSELLKTINGLKYFSKISVNGEEAAANKSNSTLAFESLDPTTLISLDPTGIKIGISDAFKLQVSDNTASINTLNSSVGALTAKDNNFEQRVSSIEEKLQGTSGESVAGLIAGAIAQAKEYTDDEIDKLEEVVLENGTTLNTIFADYLKSNDKQELLTAISEAKNEAITTILGEGNISDKFDTLKEIADWILNDTTGAAGLQTLVASHTTQIASLNTGLSNLQESLSTEEQRATLKENALLGEINTLNDTVATNAAIAAGYKINGHLISTNPTLNSDDINYSEGVNVTSAIGDLYDLWSWGEA